MPNDTIAAQGAQPVSFDTGSGASRAARAASVSTALPSAEPTPCFRCHQEIYQSFFFDGFAQSLQDDDHLSNIARLFRAHEETDNSRGIYAMYYEGMGRDLSNQTVGMIGKTASDTASALVKEAKGKFINGPAKKVASGIGKAALDGPASKTLVARGYSAIVEGINKAPETIKQNLRESLTVKKVGMDLLPAGVGILADSIQPVRDNEYASGYMGTGFNVRFMQAITDFKANVARAQKDPREIKRIRVAVFGYDRGGILARKFANELVGKVCKQEGGKVTYDGIPVEFDFMGLFDCVATSYADSIFTKVVAPVLGVVPAEGKAISFSIKGLGMFLSLSKQTLGEYDLQKEFKSIVHHVAATELRFYKNLDSPRKSPDHANLLEIVYPGSQSDVGGGFREGDDQRSAELARVSARNMLDRAWAAGVPLKPLSQLRQTNPRVAREFDFQKTVNVNGKNLTVNDLFAAYTAMLPKSNGPLETHFLEHQKLFVSWARHVHDRTAHESIGNNLFINTVDANVYNAVFPHGGGLPNYEGRDWYYKSQDPTSKVPQLTFGERRTVDDISDKTVRALATAWVHPPKLSPEVIAFFDNFVHNTITRLNNVSLGDGVFMQLREIEEKGWVARKTDAAKDYVEKVLANVSKNIQDAQDEYIRQVTSGQIPHGASIGDLSGD
ncbi:DUF2235 domain-containing protein [Burkholderia ambifaria]|uniref:phospholipase effector Tle1 domain-containing protein n=1 Tax=Burkholderia ambifaria TaxID=152480 RepID=UPI001B9F5732|nr:DUF2235 domain-containing protein [Burkholderia ambifaria]MBR8062445.1 DUF2235 domain-containing protein [Burkholderia ambifaria]MBR8174553.1 DUF2235 domain-containing protein [Burkholderia ambifaria]